MARRFALFAVAAAAFAAAATPAAAQGSIQSIGASVARSCYLAAESDASPRRDDFRNCDAALAGSLSSADDVVATFVNRGILYLRSGRFDAAITDFNRATALDPDEPEAYLNRASALLRREQVAPAIAQFNAALAKQTRRPALAYYGRGVAHEEAGNVRAAYQDYKRASELAPTWEQPRKELTRFRVVRD